MMNNKKVFGVLCLILAAAIWGGMFVVSKFTLGLISPAALITSRYIVAFAILFPLTLKSKNKIKLKEIKKRDWLLLFMIGFIGYYLSIYFVFLGIKLTDAHTGSLITTISPVFTFILAFFILKEKITILKTSSVLISLLGIMMIMDFNFSISSHFIGIFILFLAATTWAILSILVKVAVERFSSLFITTYAILFALICSLPETIMNPDAGLAMLSDYRVIFGILYMGVIATAAAYYLWNKGLEYIDAGIGSLFIFFQTVTGTIFGVLFLEESVSYNFIAGSIIIFLSITFATFSDFNTKKYFKKT